MTLVTLLLADGISSPTRPMQLTRTGRALLLPTPAEGASRDLLGMNDPEPLARLTAVGTGLLEGRRLQAVCADPGTGALVRNAGDAISNRERLGWRAGILNPQGDKPAGMRSARPSSVWWRITGG